jgi:hypothetical protein
MHNDGMLLRPVTLGGGRRPWPARLPWGGGSRGTRRRPIAHRLGRGWNGRIVGFWSRLTLRFAVRPRSLIRAAAVRLPRTHVSVHESHHLHMRETRLPAVNTQFVSSPLAASPPKSHGPADRPQITTGKLLDRQLLTKREIRTEQASRIVDVHRLRVSDHVRTESTTQSAVHVEVTSVRSVVLPSIPATRMAVRAHPPAPAPVSSPRPESVPSFESKAPVSPVLPAAPAAKLIDVEMLTDQVLWRIERRAIAQRERLGRT